MATSWCLNALLSIRSQARVIGEKADSRSGTGKIQDKPRTLYFTVKETLNLMEVCEKDRGANLKGLLLAKIERI